MSDYFKQLLIHNIILYGIIIVLLIIIFVYRQRIKAKHPPYYNINNVEGKKIASVYIWQNGTRNTKGHYSCYKFEQINDEWTLIDIKNHTLTVIFFLVIIFIPSSILIIIKGEKIVPSIIATAIFTLIVILGTILDEYLDKKRARKKFLKMLDDPSNYMHY